MEKIVDAVLGTIEVIVLSGVIGFAGLKGLHFLHNQIREEVVDALMRPTPSLSHFTKQLTSPAR